MKKGEILVLSSLLIIFIIGIVTSSYDVGDASHSLSKNTYTKNETIKGWINISLTNQLASSVFEDSEGNKMTLIELLNSSGLKETRDYDCNIKGCGSDFSTSDSGSLVKTFQLTSGKTEIIGLKLPNEVSNVNSITFDITSTALESCTNQLKIDFLNDGDIDIGNPKVSNSSSFCSTRIYEAVPMLPGIKTGCPIFL